MKVLIALDDSPHSEAALEFVRRVRWPGGSRVTVVSVVETAANPAAMALGAKFTARVLDDFKKQRQEMVARAQCRLRESGLSTDGHVLAGDAREALIAWAEREHTDLIVVGSRGHTGLAKLLLGSVSSCVVTHAACSVLVVKQGSPQ